MRVSSFKFRALMATLVAFVLIGQSAMSSDRIETQHDWCVELESQDLKHEFPKYMGGRDKVCRINVYAYPLGAADDRQLFEQIFYVDGKVSGVRKLAKLPVPSGKSVELRLKYKNEVPSEKACKGLANASIRLLLDCFLNQDSVPLIRVPSEFAASVKAALNGENFLPLDAQADNISETPINIVFQTQVANSEGTQEQLVYQP